MEESYPVLEKPMTDHQWKSVTLGIGDGILDEGGRPYWFSLDNATNQVTITVDLNKGYNHAILKGFYHRMDKEIVLDLPRYARALPIRWRCSMIQHVLISR